ncbi:helix-turn-helix domain-containing protein [Streptomyces arenae]|uniref:helix-turn-helix domain-containing protein n=1 Tax=Streptomyces arenae TaxID=29301 RepID=UPI0026580B88|nr:XRE family transcriptional regulator [Streptomyces arenae]MCG7210771.1 XRE family transcriptional regulator [Streptomyces arenae]
MTPERTRLAASLRELRARTGLSMAALATKTAFSKSSWERYLNGKSLPPRQAVQDLCRLAGEPDGRCLALWEIAESEWSGRAQETPAPPPAATPSPTTPSPTTTGPATATATDPATATGPATAAGAGASSAAAPAPVSRLAGHRSVVAVAVTASVCAVAVGAVAVAAALLPPGADGASRASAEAPPHQDASPSAPRCRGAACEGRNPMGMRCAGSPVTLATRHTTGGAWLEVRYSKECGTSWARMWGTRVGDRLEVTADGRVHGAEIRTTADADAFVYTPMTVTTPGTTVRTCFRPAGDGGRECVTSVPR